MQNETSTLPQEQQPWIFPDPALDRLPLFRKLLLAIDSCVGILKRNDFLNFETELINEDISDLSRFCYQSFRTVARAKNETEPLISYLFRTSAYSLFGHIIVNAQKEYPSFLNVVMGTPGMGKSASRYPFITLLMSSGVTNVTTIKKGEGAFVFLKHDTKNTGTVKIRTEVNKKPVDFDTPSFLYTYGVWYFNPPPLSNEDLKKEQPYNSEDYAVNPQSPPPTASFLGQISVPSVEYFPYFARLMMGTDKSKPFDKPLEKLHQLEKDMIITQASVLVGGSWIEKGSILYENQLEYQNKLYKVQEQIILVKGSVLSKGSRLIQNNTDPDQFIDDGSGDVYDINPEQSSRTIQDDEELIKFDQIVEKGTVFKNGSRVTLKAISATRDNFPIARKIERDYIVEAGSIIKKGSKIASRSTLNPYSIQNGLLNTTWHVIDDLQIIDEAKLKTAEFHVLFSSPKGSRWKTLNQDDKTSSLVIIESVIPKYTPKEEAAFLNTIEPLEELNSEAKTNIKRGVELFSFIPRFVTNETLSSKAIQRVSTSDKYGIPKDEEALFDDRVSHKLVHFSCPQFDCNNWHTEFATDLAKRNILHVFGVKESEDYIAFLKTMEKSSDQSQKKGAIFHTFVSDAIVQGFIINQPKRVRSTTQIRSKENGRLKTVSTIQLPPAIGETYVHLRGPSNMSSAELPDIKAISPEKFSELPAFSDCLFVNHMTMDGVITRELQKADNVPGSSQQQGDPPDAPKTLRRKGRPRRTPTATTTPNPSNLKCFTFYLNPLGANNVGFDSILLFFQVYNEQGQWKIHKLSVMFIQSTMASTHPMSDSGPNLMYLWLCLLSAVYNLQQEQIFPYLFYVTPPIDGTTNYGNGASTGFFMNQNNIWKFSYSPTDAGVSEVKNHGRLMVNCVDPLPANDNPYHFRCAFCGAILEELFVDHKCGHVKTKGAGGLSTDTAWTIASSNVGFGMFDRPKPMERENLPKVMDKFVYNLWSSTSNGGIDRSGGGPRVFEIELKYPDVGFLPNIHKSPRTFDMMDVIMIPLNDPEKPCRPPTVMNRPRTTRRSAYTSAFTIHPTQPLPNFFSLVSPMSEDLAQISNDQIDQLEDFELDISDSTNHLSATLYMVRLWTNYIKIEFLPGERQTIHGTVVQSSNVFVDLDLWENMSIPICPMYVPTSCFGRLPVIVDQTCQFTMSDIRTLLLSPDSLLSSPSPESMFNKHIGNREPLKSEEVTHLLKRLSAKAPLLSADLVPLSTRIPHLESVDKYDLQLLISVVNGTRNHIWEILGKCCEYLDSPSKISEEKADLNAMEQRLKNGHSIALKRLRPFLDRLGTGNRNFTDFGEDSFEFKCLKDEPLLPRLPQSLLIPWVMKDVLGRAQPLLRQYHSSETFLKHDRWILLASMMIHAPIPQSERDTLKTVIKTYINDEFQEYLLCLVEHYTNESSEPNYNTCLVEDIKQVPRNAPTFWNITLMKFIDTGSLEQLETDFLNRLFSEQAPKLEKTDGLIEAINSSSAPLKDKETLIALVCGLPRLSTELRKSITPELPVEDQRSGLITKIKAEIASLKNAADHQKSLADLESLENAVNHQKSLTYDEEEKLEEFIKSTTTFSDDEKSTLKSLVLHNLLLSSDTILVWNYVLTQLSDMSQNTTDMFKSFREAKPLHVSQNKDDFKKHMNEIRNSISEAHLLLFRRFEEKQFTQKDFAGLLCCPNVERSFSLPALGDLFPKTSNQHPHADDNTEEEQISVTPNKQDINNPFAEFKKSNIRHRNTGDIRLYNEDVNDMDDPSVHSPKRSSPPSEDSN
ncbi:hypothetical protein BLNAU_4457 [Blattamonas nauphoetae]|uniref:Uncharacterized protein n=1 Tax=Blattamonas nauphoetae TaxID=2049346 RepID=A0ABQ9YA80_9EUKA|nr:hypothetical protein BLNAU_4457 [Blattamonas nauphoetae]